MPIGNGPDCYNGNVPEEDRQIKLQEKVEAWWNSLDYDYKIELMENNYPDEANMIEVDEMWNGLDWNEKWDIYRGEKDEVIDYD